VHRRIRLTPLVIWFVLGVPIIGAPVRTIAPQSLSTPDSSRAIAGAPTLDSLARLLAERFTTGSAAAFDSVYTDPLGRRVMHAAAERKTQRVSEPARVVWTRGNTAVLLFTPTVGGGQGRGLSSGGDETNTVRRLSGFYEAARIDGEWRLGRQVPIDSGSFIRAQRIHVALDPGHDTHIVDTLDIAIGAPSGFAARLNNHAQITRLSLDGRDVPHQLAGGVLWFAATARPRARLVIEYAIAEDERASTDSTAANGPPAYGALENTDGWLPFFGYDSGNDFAQITVTVTIPAAYRLTTSIPQTEHVANGIRTVRGESIHPQFILSLIYDKDWRVTTTTIGNFRFESFITPTFHFTHDSLASIITREYRLLTPRFGDPQPPSRYLAVVESRVLKGAGFTVRMNNAVVAGDNVTRLDEPTLGPSAAFVHEVAHGWTMDASGPAANFLQEGWATYCESLLLRELYGPAAEQAVWERIRTSYFGGQDRAGFQGGFEGRQSLLGDPDNGRIHYYKGSWIFHMLEHVLGASVFDRGMRTFVAHAGYGPNGYQQLIADMSLAAGHDVGPFIMPWLTEKYVPDVDARVEGRSVIVTQSQPTRSYDLPLDVELHTSAGVVRRSVHITGRADTIDVSASGTVSDARVDPDHHFLLRRHWGDSARFVLRAPEAKKVELTGNFLAQPLAATRDGDLWTVSLFLPEGRYVYIWRVDGTTTPDELALRDAERMPGNVEARAGVLVVRPVRRLPERDQH